MAKKVYKLQNGYTLSKVIDMIYAGNNGKRASEKNEGGGLSCKYLTDDGNKCAVGCFLPQGHPGQKYGQTVNRLIEQYPELEASMPLSTAGMLSLQDVHDDFSDNSDPRPRMVAWLLQNVSKKVV